MTDSTVSVPVTVQVPSVGWQGVRCARCDQACQPAQTTSMTPDGVWLQVTVRDCLTLTVEPGNSTYVDRYPPTEDRFFVLCHKCADWLRTQVPGLDRLLKRIVSG